MGAFDKWAKKTSIPRVTTDPPKRALETKPVLRDAGQSPSASVTLYTVDGQPVILSAGHPVPTQPAPNLVAVHRPNQLIVPNQVRARRSHHAKECMLVKQDGEERYTKFLQQLPDLVAEGRVADLSEGVNALELRGQPENAVMSKWTGRSRYYNGRFDEDGKGTVDDRLGDRYGESSANIRMATSIVVTPK